MKDTQPEKRRLVIVEDDNQRRTKPTTSARSGLYRLIAGFRKQADNADDPRTRSIFEFAVEVLSGLSRAFKRHEKEIDDQDNHKSNGNSNP